MLKVLFVKTWKPLFSILVLLTVSLQILWAQDVNEKYSLTTKMFLQELKEKAHPSMSKPRRALPPKITADTERFAKRNHLIASPDTVGSVAYISCFIYLKDPSDLSEVSSLGVTVEQTFNGLSFVTAQVPVNQMERLAQIDNVTLIKVAQEMLSTTDVARQKTNADDLLTMSGDAVSRGVISKYDGTGVVLGIIDMGIDFQHIAFKDKNGNSRIKRAYVQTSTTGTEYTSVSGLTTDDNTNDHGTHTASTAGGSSVIMSGSTVTVTDNHANATYGGMAPGADLYLAGVKLKDTYIINALTKMVQYANAQNKPLVVSNSWGSQIGPHDGTGEIAEVVAQYFGDSHPDRVILFSSSNDADKSKDNEGGGLFIKKSAASSSSPLGTILRNCYNNTDGGFIYSGYVSSAWSSQPLGCKIYVLDNSTGAVKTSWTVSSNQTSFDGLSTYYSGSLYVFTGIEKDKYYLQLVGNNLQTNDYTTTTKNGMKYYISPYTLAIEVFPASGSSNVDMWANSGYYLSNHLSTVGHNWTAGTDDMSVSTQATIPDAISVGAYVSKTSQKNYQGSTYSYSAGSLGDIANFSSYATATQSPTGIAYPWITAPGAQVVAGVNHYHTADVDDGSYYHSDNIRSLVVNNSSNPYAAMQGTSMATPVVAGIVAQWLQAAKSVGMSLTINDVKDIMAQTAITDAYTNGSNASHFGKGKIDALAGIQYILASSKKLTLSANPASGIINYMQEVTLTASNPNAEIYCTFDGSEPTKDDFLYDPPLQIDHSLTMKAKAFLDGYEDSETLAREYQVKLDIAADCTSGTVRAGQMVTLSSSHPEATIYYTIDGTTPNSQSNVYTSPISIDSTMTINAVAMYEGCLQSNLLTRNYTVRSVTLSISPTSSGLLPAGTEITLTANPANAAIFYTTDGSEPTMASTLYVQPIVINQNMTIKAKAYYEGYKESDVITQQYEVTSLAATTFFPEQNGRTLNRHIIPSVTFNGNIREGNNFNDIHLLKGNDIIEGTPIIVDDILYFVPNSDELETGSYTFSIPESSIICNSNNNLETQQLFSVNKSVKPAVAAGHTHSFIIKDDGSLWAWGNNYAGKLGDGTSINRTLPVKVSDDIIAVAAGESHSLAIKNDSSLWAWGRNRYGQLGDGTTTSSYSPVKILEDAVAVTAGPEYSLALKQNRDLWAWGYNGHGCLGDGTHTNHISPVKVFDDVISITAGYEATCAVKSNTSLWGWGYNDYSLFGYSGSSDTPKKCFDDVVSAAIGIRHTLVILNNSSLWACGANGGGQLGDGTNTDRSSFVKILDGVIAIAAGRGHSLAIKSDNSLWVWGLNNYGQLGDKTTTNRKSPQKILDGVVAIAAGEYHSLAIKNDGSIWAWGRNNYGQLGDGTTTDQSTPVKIIDASQDIEMSNLIVDKSLSLHKGEKTLILPQLEPVNANYEIMEWNSSDETIATVSSRGIVTGIAPGEAILAVKVTSKEGTEFTAQCIVTVTEATEQKYPTTGAYIVKADYSLEGGTSYTQEEWTVTLTKDNTEERKYWIEGIIPKELISSGYMGNEDVAVGIKTDKVYGYLQKDGNILIPNHQDIDGYLNSYYTKNYSSNRDISVTIDYDENTMSVSDSWGISVRENLLEENNEEEYLRFENMTFRMKKEEESILKGDVNGDNIVDREDAIAVANYVMKKPSPSFNATAADVNGDGIINITDAIAIENIIKQNK